MAQSTFVAQSVELAFVDEGKTVKQTINNLKETVSSDQLLELGKLFDEMSPEDIKLEEIVTVKRVRHSEN